MTEPIDDLRRLARGRPEGPEGGADVRDAERVDREREAAAISADLVKLGASGLGVAYALLGYTYSAQFFRGFGMSISDVDLTYLDLFHRGVVLTLEPLVFAATVCASLFLYGVYRMRVHHRLPPRLVPLVAVLFLLSAAFLGVRGGQSLGDAHARQVWWEGTRGKPAYCSLDAEELAVIVLEDGTETTIAGTIDGLSEAGRLRIVHRSEAFLYLAPVLGSAPEADAAAQGIPSIGERARALRDVVVGLRHRVADRWSDLFEGLRLLVRGGVRAADEPAERTQPVVGESYAIPNSAVHHCRIQSADLGGPEPGAGDV